MRHIAILVAAHAYSHSCMAAYRSLQESEATIVVVHDEEEIPEPNPFTRTRLSLDTGITLTLEAMPKTCEPYPIDLKKVNEHPFEKFMSSKHRRKHRY